MEKTLGIYRVIEKVAVILSCILAVLTFVFELAVKENWGYYASLSCGIAWACVDMIYYYFYGIRIGVQMAKIDKVKKNEKKKN